LSASKARDRRHLLFPGTLIMKTRLALLTLAAMLAAAPALAREPIFVGPAQSHGAEIIASPPAADSDATKAELAELHALEASRGQAQADQAIWDDLNETVFLYRTVFGERFNEQTLPKLAAFAKRVRSDEGVNSDPAKQAFHRVRPYNLDKTLHPICKTKTLDDSYPSGHATSGYLLGLTLIEMVPEKHDEILARAETYAFDRLVCGVHYRSDLDASKRLAYTVHAIMTQNPLYREEMTEARAELRGFLGLAMQ
jgi:acid phosphatase (class A)